MLTIYNVGSFDDSIQQHNYCLKYISSYNTFSFTYCLQKQSSMWQYIVYHAVFRSVLILYSEQSKRQKADRGGRIAKKEKNECKKERKLPAHAVFGSVHAALHTDAHGDDCVRLFKSVNT